MREFHYDRHVGVDNHNADYALELTLRDPNSDTLAPERVVRIPVEDIPDFLDAVVRHGTRALTTAARRLEVGHCETCGNTGLVDTVKHGRPSNEYCPDCRGRWPAEPFANAPKIGKRDKEG